MMDGVSHGPDTIVTTPLVEQKNTPKAEEALVDIQSHTDSAISQLRFDRSKNGPASETIVKGRQAMLRSLGDFDPKALKDAFPAIKNKLIDETGSDGLKYGKENYDCTLINDAIAKNNIPDIEATLEMLEAPSVTTDGPPELDAVKQLCYTLTRQLNKIKQEDPNNPQLLEIKRRLNEVKNSAFTEGVMKDNQLNLPLAVLEDEDALTAVGSKDAKNPRSVDAYANRRFNLKTLAFEKITNEAKVKKSDEDGMLKSIRNDISQEVAANHTANIKSADNEQNLHDRIEIKHESGSLSSDESEYQSSIGYEIRDIDELFDYIKSGRLSHDNHEYFQEMRGKMPLGPSLGKLGDGPSLNVDRTRERLSLMIKIPQGINASFANPTQTENLLAIYKQVMGNKIRDVAKISVSDRGFNNTNLDIIYPNPKTPFTLATLIDGEMHLNVNTFLPDPHSKINSPAELRQGLHAALELWRIYATEYYKQEQKRVKPGEETIEIPQIKAELDPFFQEKFFKRDRYGRHAA